MSGAEIPTQPNHARQVYNLQQIYSDIGDRYEHLVGAIQLDKLDPLTQWDPDTLAKAAILTAFQYTELVPDQVAAASLNRRVDWKYALKLSTRHQGVTEQTLCAFRRNVLASDPALAEYDKLLEQLGELGLYSRNVISRLNSRQVLVVVCKASLVYQLYSGMKSALAVLVSLEPTWLTQDMPSYWYKRYQTGALAHSLPVQVENLDHWAHRLGMDIEYLLTRLENDGLAHIQQKPEIKHLSDLLTNQFTRQAGKIAWRCPPQCSQCIKKSDWELTSFPG